MNKKYVSVLIALILFCSLSTVNISGETSPGKIYEGNQSVIYRNVTVYAPAVATTDDGYVGVISTITVTIQNNGSGRVFVDTHPLTQVDMQGSARLAVKVASTLVRNDKTCDLNPDKFDYFFVVRTSSPIIGGPSAGGVMTVATVSLLEEFSINNRTVMTGMINPDGSIGPIGGITHKVDAANSVGANRFLIPRGQNIYTEMVTTTESTNGWIRTVTKPVQRNIADYAMDNYGIEVNEVEDINDALMYFTGHRFDTNQSTSIINTEDYNTSMKPLATRLLSQSERALENSTETIEKSGISNYYHGSYKDYVEEEVDNAKETLKEAKRWFNESLYYSSTSKSFQSLIHSRFVEYACGYYEYGNETWIESLLDDAQNIYENASKTAKNAKINGYITLQSVGAAQRRVSETHSYLSSAKDSYENIGFFTFSEVMDFLYNIAFVVERCNSVSWWIEIGENFNDTGNIANNTIENLALEYIEEAQQSVFYSNVIIGEISNSYGDSTSYLSSAQNLIDSAQDDLDKGYSAASLFEALEALVKANIAIEIIGTNAEEKVDYASENANKNIANIRNSGIEPILAVSYYEFAETLKNESSFDSALIYYKYSGMIAGALSYTNISCGTTSSTYVGIPKVSSGNNIYQTILLYGFSFLIIIGIGVILGMGLGLVIAGGKSKKEKKKIIYRKKEISKDPSDYPNNQIPKSIRDYYKKNK